MSHSQHDCSQMLEKMLYFLDNELEQADCAEVQRHLDECGPCLRMYDLERTVKGLVARSCAEQAPESLRERVLLAVHQVQVQVSESGPQMTRETRFTQTRYTDLG